MILTASIFILTTVILILTFNEPILVLGLKPSTSHFFITLRSTLNHYRANKTFLLKLIKKISKVNVDRMGSLGLMGEEELATSHFLKFPKGHLKKCQMQLLTGQTAFNRRRRRIHFMSKIVQRSMHHINRIISYIRFYQYILRVVSI